MLSLDKDDFGAFLLRRRNQWFTDATLELNSNEIRVNKMLLSSRSAFFRHLFSGNYAEEHHFSLDLPNHFSIVVDILLNYGMMGVVVVPVDFTAGAWMELAELAEYFCMEDLMSICESQLCSRLHSDNHQ